MVDREGKSVTRGKYKGSEAGKRRGTQQEAEGSDRKEDWLDRCGGAEDRKMEGEAREGRIQDGMGN